MKNKASIIYFTFLFVIFVKCGYSQSYSVEFNVSGQPNNTVIIGAIHGDNFVAIDSILASSEKIHFNFPPDAHEGVYRIILGKTPYARIMNEAPQYLDFIFNKEDIIINTNFKHSIDSVKVLKSKENALWFSFLNYEQNYKKQFTTLQKELDVLWDKKDITNALEKSNELNFLQMTRDLDIRQSAKHNKGLLATKMIDQYREPVLDAFITPEEQKTFFQEYFFKTVDFSTERLIHSSIYTDKIFQYLVSYNNPSYTQNEREKEYIKAVDVILENTNKNEKVYRFIIEYMIHGFSVLKLEKVISYINENNKQLNLVLVE